MTYRRFLGRFYALTVLTLSSGCRHAQMPLAQVPLSQLPATDVRPDQAAIVGRVISSRGATPLASAFVRLRTPAGALVDSVSADQAGVFVLGPTLPGVYRLEIHMIFHRPYSATHELRAGATDSLTARLRYSEPGSLIADCIGLRADGTQGFGLQFCRY
jgi:hypothetical protein